MTKKDWNDSSVGHIINTVTNMGNLKPGAKYIYERVGGVVYAREEGADPSTRFKIGEIMDSRTYDGRPLHDHIMEDKLWGDIRRTARTNPTLQAELERVIMLYHLVKEESKPAEWHPV